MSKIPSNWPVFPDDAPVVRISDAGGTAHGIHRSANAFDYFRRMTRHLRSGSATDNYVGCLVHPSDGTMAFFSVDDIDPSVSFRWKPEDDWIRFLDTDEDSAVKPDVPPKAAPKVNVVSERAALPERPAALTMGSGSGEPAAVGGELVRRMRSLRGMSRSQLAERLGVASSRIAELELAKGPQGPTLAVIRRVADACEIDLDISLRPRRRASK